MNVLLFCFLFFYILFHKSLTDILDMEESTMVLSFNLYLCAKTDMKFVICVWWAGRTVSQQRGVKVSTGPCFLSM